VVGAVKVQGGGGMINAGVSVIIVCTGECMGRLALCVRVFLAGGERW